MLLSLDEKYVRLLAHFFDEFVRSHQVMACFWHFVDRAVLPQPRIEWVGFCSDSLENGLMGELTIFSST
jgi:hypothetical protein